MRTRRFLLFLAVATAFILAGVFEARSDVTKDEQKGYKKQMEEKLKTIDKQIRELKKKGAQFKAEARTDYNEEM